MAIRKSNKRSPETKEEVLGPQVSARLYKRDKRYFLSVVGGEFKGNESLAVRELISEALTARRLKGIGRDESLSAVKDAQREVISGELSEIKNMLSDLLSIAKGQGTIGDRILMHNRESIGLLFHVLKTIFNIEELAQDYLAKPALEATGKDEDEINEIFSEAETDWTSETANLLERVRSQMQNVVV